MEVSIYEAINKKMLMEKECMWMSITPIFNNHSKSSTLSFFTTTMSIPQDGNTLFARNLEWKD